jgi:hypothetical protein
MTCPRCQEPIIPGAKFCLNCGLPLTTPPGTKAGQAPGEVGGPPASRPTSEVAGATGPFASPPIPVPSPYATSYPPYGAPPSQPLYAAPSAPTYPPAMQPPYGTTPPAPYAAAPSQPLSYGYGAPMTTPQPYGAPATVPLNLDASAGMGLLPGLFGTPPSLVAPQTRLQAFLVRNINARLAVSAWFTALLGAVAAIVLGLLLTAIAESVWSSAIKSIVSAVATNSASTDISGLISSLLSPDLLKLFMIEQHVPLDFHVGASAGGTGGSVDIGATLPITGLLLIPAVALTAGGYLSAASDFTRRARFSIARGALIGPFYGVLLAILTLFSATNISAQILGAGLSVSVTPNTGAAFVFGVLWGVIFGALGGWLQIAGRQSFADTLPMMRSSSRNRLLGALSGAVVALASGIAIFAVLVVGGLVAALTAQHATITPNEALTGASAGSNSAVVIVLLAFAFAPTIGIIAFTIAAGSSFDVFQTASITANGAQHVSYGFIGTHFHPSGALYLMMLVPLICYIAGGRVSARIAQARRLDDAILAGALIALPFSVLFAGTAALTGFSIDISVLIASASGARRHRWAAPFWLDW